MRVSPGSNRRWLSWSATLGSALVLSGVLSAGEASLSYADLAERLIDFVGLAKPPLASERCAQWSSYDRASRYDAATGRYERWDANGDGGGYIRRENGRFVLAEMEGPGCIWRVWSARPEDGHVRMYLDGVEKPVIDLPFKAWFDRSTEPFTRPALVHTVAMGWNNYTPIPFQKSCKIVAEPGWGAYYQFVYSIFPKGTRVPTFSMALSEEDKAALDRVNSLLEHAGPYPRADLPHAGVTTERHQFSASHGGGRIIGLNGPGAISGLRLRLQGAPEDPAQRRRWLRHWTIRIRWDGETEPSVWAPVGDFFGSFGGNPYRSWPAGLTEAGWWYANWYMPFARQAEIFLANDSDLPGQAVLEIDHGPLEGDPAQWLRFHAKWHRDAFLPEEPERRIDWTLLRTRGQGRLVGVQLHVWNPRGGWWGEGDEKFFVDGERFPSTFGTGSEDYFGYAWCNPTPFENAFHNQTLCMNNNKGHVSVNRWHIADNVPFHESFEAYIEKYFPNDRPTLYAATVFWYLAPGGEDPYRPVGPEERAGYWDEEMLAVWRAPGALEGEQLEVLACTGGQTQIQNMVGFEGRWSGDAQLWWTGGKPGDRLELALPVERPGRYTLKMRFTRAADYGVARILLDGKPLGEPIDFYHQGVVATRELALGEAELTAGRHRLTVEITGAHPQAIKAYMFGLDYVKLEPR